MQIHEGIKKKNLSDPCQPSVIYLTSLLLLGIEVVSSFLLLSMNETTLTLLVQEFFMHIVSLEYNSKRIAGSKGVHTCKGADHLTSTYSQVEPIHRALISPTITHTGTTPHPKTLPI